MSRISVQDRTAMVEQVARAAEAVAISHLIGAGESTPDMMAALPIPGQIGVQSTVD